MGQKERLRPNTQDSMFTQLTVCKILMLMLTGPNLMVSYRLNLSQFERQNTSQYNPLKKAKLLESILMGMNK